LTAYSLQERILANGTRGSRTSLNILKTTDINIVFRITGSSINGLLVDKEYRLVVLTKDKRPNKVEP
jgi:hypothetical protein